MTTQTTIPLARLIAREGIRMTADWTDTNPNMEPDDWARSASHYRCTFRKGRQQMTTYFSMGSAHTQKPTAATVLDCLASDASTVDPARGFEDWASELGYDPDSRKAERTYRTIQRQADKLRRFLGHDAYHTLLYECERL